MAIALSAVSALIAQAEIAAPTAESLLAYTQHFTESAKGPEFVMPVGSGDLSAMVSFDSALHLHFSKSDWFGRPLNSVGNGAGGGSGKVAAMSPGNVTLELGNLAQADIRSFDQFMDFSRGSVIVKIGTDTGSVEMEVFGDMTRHALIVSVKDGRTNRGNASVKLANWRDTMRISTQGNSITGEEIHQITMDGKPVTDHAKVPANDALYNLGLGVAVGSKNAAAANSALEVPANKAAVFDVVVTAEVTRDGKPLVPALAKLEQLLNENPKTLRDQQLAWWKAFRDQSWIEITGDEDAKYLTRLWWTDLYTFAGIFSGKLPPTFNGSQLLVMQDYSSWVGAYTWQNTRELIWPMGAANHLDFAELYFRTCDRHFSNLQQMTREAGKMGIRVPEYVWIKDDPAGHLQPAAATRQATPFDKTRLEDRTNLSLENGGPSHINHIFADGGELVQLMFDHVRYTGDEKFLKEVCAPWLRETALFYLSFLKQGEDGLWHMTPSNAAESWWKVKDPITDLCAVRSCFEQVVKHGKQFGYEPELILLAQDRLKNLAPIPLGRWKERPMSMEEVAEFKEKFPGKRITQSIHFDGIDRDALFYPPAADIGDFPTKHNMENPELYVVFPFGRVGLESSSQDLHRGINTFKDRKCLNSYGWSPDGIQAARLGLPDTADVILHHALRQQIYPYGGWINCAGALPGTVTKVPKTAARFITDTPQLDTAGVNMTAIQEMLLQSHDSAEAEQLLDGGPIRLLPATRKDWSGRFKLRARGGFIVTCEFQKEFSPAHRSSPSGGGLCVWSIPSPSARSASTASLKHLIQNASSS
jgi:hypothetical protein